MKEAVEVLFSCKKSIPFHSQLTFNGSVVAKVNEQKHLGLLLDSGLSFDKHLNDGRVRGGGASSPPPPPCKQPQIVSKRIFFLKKSYHSFL